MNEDSMRLLQEVNAGCKNAVNSFDQVEEFVKDESLEHIITEYKKEHQLIGDIAHQLLNNGGEDEMDPPSIAKAMMWVTTEVKMMLDENDSKAAELLVDGCHTGIKSLRRYLRQFEKSGEKERALAGRLMNLEMELYKKLLAYL